MIFSRRHFSNTGCLAKFSTLLDPPTNVPPTPTPQPLGVQLTTKTGRRFSSLTVQGDYFSVRPRGNSIIELGHGARGVRSAQGMSTGV